MVVNYWATWCPPCLEEISELELFHNRYKDSRAVVLGVNMEDIAANELSVFVEEQFISYPVLRSEPRLTTELGSVPGLPTTYVVAPDGRLAGRQVGPVTVQMLEDFLAQHEKQYPKLGVQK